MGDLVMLDSDGVVRRSGVDEGYDGQVIAGGGGALYVAFVDSAVSELSVLNTTHTRHLEYAEGRTYMANAALSTTCRVLGGFDKFDKPNKAAGFLQFVASTTDPVVCVAPGGFPQVITPKKAGESRNLPLYCAVPKSANDVPKVVDDLFGLTLKAISDMPHLKKRHAAGLDSKSWLAASGGSKVLFGPGTNHPLPHMDKPLALATNRVYKFMSWPQHRDDNASVMLLMTIIVKLVPGDVFIPSTEEVRHVRRRRRFNKLEVGE